MSMRSQEFRMPRMVDEKVNQMAASARVAIALYLDDVSIPFLLHKTTFTTKTNIYKNDRNKYKNLGNSADRNRYE